MIQMPPVQVSYFPLRGGLNQVSSPLAIQNGMCRDALNFECEIDGGYRRIAGYERYDGRPEPSAATFYRINCTITGALAAGNLVTGSVTSSTAIVIAVGTDFVIVTKRSAGFVAGENLIFGGTPRATTISEDIAESADTQKLFAQYKNLAADRYRTDIQPISGSGPVRGVWRYNGNTYAFRDNALATAGVMWKATATGWTSVSLGTQVAFSNANTSVEDGDTLTQGAVTATIVRVVVQSGTLASGVNTGILIISNVAGGNFSAAGATTTGGGSLTLSGAESNITLPAGGRYEFVNHNFGGSVASYRMYGVNGVGKGFEFDGTVFVPITTGMSTDTPDHIAVHKNHLFYSFGASVQHSGVSDPHTWTAITGAGELAVGEDVTGFLSMTGSEANGALAIFSSDQIKILYGNDSSDWNLVTHSDDTGAKEWTVQLLGSAYALDDMGVRQALASQAFGNFEQAIMSHPIKPFIQAKKNLVVASCSVRERNQYRLFFSDKYALYVTFANNQVIGMMPVLYAHAFNCVSSQEEGGEEFVFAGSAADGYVYRLEKGTSFDGDDIEAYMIMAFNHFGSPRLRKRFRKAIYEASGDGYAEYLASYELGYATTEITQGVSSTVTTTFGGAFWDSFTWDAFFWDGRTLLPTEQEIEGTAENLSLTVRSSGDYFYPFTLSSVIVQFTPRRQMR